ncbi:MAG: thermonuclease family protein [Pseudomonadota bacterium]
MARRRRVSAFGKLISLGLTLACFVVVAFLIVHLERSNGQKIAGNPHVIDGDSLKLNDLRLRLLGIDAPELAQTCFADGRQWACGQQAGTQLRRKINGALVLCTTWGEDRYQRILATCSAGEQELNAWLVRNGWAVDYGGYGREEAEARRNRAGIWKGTFENPGEWRRVHSSQAFAVPHTMPSWIQKWWVWLLQAPNAGGADQ